MQGTPYLTALNPTEWKSTLGFLKLSLQDLDFNSTNKEKEDQIKNAHTTLQAKNPYFQNLRFNQPTINLKDRLNHVILTTLLLNYSS